VTTAPHRSVGNQVECGRAHAAGWSPALLRTKGPAVTGTIDPTLLDDLVWRGLVAHSTDLGALREALSAGRVRFYVGFDPTAPSLHMGNLVQLVTARRLQIAGHTPYILVGGATGMIGDPKESSERTLNSLDTVKDWSERVRRQVEPFVSFEGPNAATIVNNYDWTASLSTIDFLRDIGKHFPVNRMLQRDVVSRRLESGISYTEFSYVLLQSMDFLNLFREHGVTLQHGATDQWGNITAGVELIRRAAGAQAHAFVTPLITKPDGTKYGKTESDALWLDPQMMSPYSFHQWWLNVDDSQVGELLRIFSFLSHEEIKAVEQETRDEPWKRSGQRLLADEVTTFVHGAEETEHARAAADALFGGGDLHALSPATLGAALREAGSTTVPALLPVVDLLVESGLAKSKGEARRTISEGGAYVNNVRVEDPEAVPDDSELIGGSWLVLRRGKKQFAGVEVG
jgi:tyrosyl-tRNA synthetase